MGAPHNSMMKALAAAAFFTPLFLRMEQSRQLKKKLDKNPKFLNAGQQAQFKECVRNDLLFYGIGGALVSGLAKNFIGSGMSSLTYYIMNNINKPAEGPAPDTEIEKSARDYLSTKTTAEMAADPRLLEVKKMLDDKDALKADKTPENGMLKALKKHILI